jgi:DNA invertase Pin-like site-specific DNA recombinase
MIFPPVAVGASTAGGGAWGAAGRGGAVQAHTGVLYLRVSTPGQMNTDYDPEGISIPTQRTKCQERALTLGAEIVEEFIEPGRTATTIDGRKEFQRMMAFIRAEKSAGREIDYVIVFSRSRLFRNSVDAAITKRELRKLGCVIISILDYTEDTPVGDLVATVLDAVNEFQSKAQGADIALKMAGKVQRGGSVARAQLGYLNVREIFEGREIRTIAVDPERAPLVVMGFELFATGTTPMTPRWTPSPTPGCAPGPPRSTRPARPSPSTSSARCSKTASTSGSSTSRAASTRVGMSRSSAGPCAQRSTTARRPAA